MYEKLHSYSSPFTVGHRALARFEDRPGIFEVPVFVEEKVDGSQFSFTRVGNDVKFRSRKQQVYLEAAGMFKNGVEAILEIKDQLEEGWVYRGEYLSKPKHNTLAYDRVPNRHVIIFDIETEPNNFMDPEERSLHVIKLGMESVPIYYKGKVENLEQLRDYLKLKSVLGGPIEGIVVKPIGHCLFGQDKKMLMAKFVSEDFKEKHVKEWKEGNPVRKDVVQELIESYRTPQRWNKAVQHLREAGELESSPRDIGKLMKEVPQDVLKDSEEEIKEVLFKFFWKQISRGLTAGLPEYYKQKLLEGASENPKEYEVHESVKANKGSGASPNTMHTMEEGKDT